jgi:hypothetical protein
LLSLSSGILTLLTIFALVLALAAGAGVLVLLSKLRQVKASYARLLAGGPEGEDILAAVDRHLAAVERMQTTSELVGREVAGLRQRVSTLVQTVGFQRYDAFDDVGGQMSFSAALLNEAGDGVVITSINSRSETRSYAKPVEAGLSTHNLSEEERIAIAKALGGDLSIDLTDRAATGGNSRVALA